MSGRRVNHSLTCSCLDQTNNVSHPARTPSWSPSSNVTGANSLRHPATPNGSEFSCCSRSSEKSKRPNSPRLPLRRICMGQPYNSKYVENSHLRSVSKEARRSVCQGPPRCLVCTDRPSGPSSPTFLDQLIKGINYLDRSTNAFYNTSSLSLPRLAASCLERAANSIHLGRQDCSYVCSYSSPSTSVAASDTASTCMVPSTKEPHVLQYTDDSVNTSCPYELHSRRLSPTPQRPDIKLPELPLFGNGIFSLGRLPKFWEAIRSGWRAPEPISKPCSWW